MSKTAIHDRWGRLGWQVPLVASAITFVLATGFSISNEDIRPGVQAIRLALLALWTVIGFGLTAIGFRAVANGGSVLRHGTIALVLNTMLGVATVVGIVAAYAHSHDRRAFPARSVADYQAPAHAARAWGLAFSSSPLAWAEIWKSAPISQVHRCRIARASTPGSSLFSSNA